MSKTTIVMLSALSHSQRGRVPYNKPLTGQSWQMYYSKLATDTENVSVIAYLKEVFERGDNICVFGDRFRGKRDVFEGWLKKLLHFIPAEYWTTQTAVLFGVAKKKTLMPVIAIACTQVVDDYLAHELNHLVYALEFRGTQVREVIARGCIAHHPNNEYPRPIGKGVMLPFVMHRLDGVYDNLRESLLEPRTEEGKVNE
jgi:hypothetical protein